MHVDNGHILVYIGHAVHGIMLQSTSCESLPMKHPDILRTVSPFVFGTTRLGDDQIPFDDRVNVAWAAMNAGVWFHTSRHYGNALEVLRAAFDRDRKKIPRLIIKSFGDSVEKLTADVKSNLDPLGLESLDVAQLCIEGTLAEDLASGGPSLKGLEQIRESGLVRQFVWEVFPWTSERPTRALQKGYTPGIIDAFIFYLNPLQRFASNELWDLLVKQRQPIIAMRTVSGGPVHRLRDVPGAAWKEYLQKRAVEVAPIFEHSGIKSWTEFCVRFAHSFPTVLATVGSSGKLGHLDEFLEAMKNIQPLPGKIVNEIVSLHYRWSEELDVHAEPWSM
jgi:aryl-alcohol dehydrogenase-like predicted oxidoreductase